MKGFCDQIIANLLRCHDFSADLAGDKVNELAKKAGKRKERDRLRESEQLYVFHNFISGWPVL